MYAGTKYMFGPDIMLGALAQFDATQEFAEKSHGSMTASGWMTGPYTSIRFGPGVVFDGRMAWGTAETSGGYFPEGETSERRLVRGTLRGSRDISGWTVTPSVGMSYLEDKPTNQNSHELRSQGRPSARGGSRSCRKSSGASPSMRRRSSSRAPPLAVSWLLTIFPSSITLCLMARFRMCR